jgi:membrane-bound lytic murein transglycosylase MltF
MEKLRILVWSAVLLFIAACMAIGACIAHAADLCQQYRPTLTREAQAVFGLNAPIPALVSQLYQESHCDADVTAWDNGRGLAQFMDGTAAQVAKTFPELGVPDPYNPKWAIRAQVRYDDWLGDRVKGDDACQHWAAIFKSYNAGVGFVIRAQHRSPQPGLWFNVTENINAGQGAKNFEYSRLYPRLILFKHQHLYAAWGQTLCLERAP